MQRSNECQQKGQPKTHTNLNNITPTTQKILGLRNWRAFFHDPIALRILGPETKWVGYLFEDQGPTTKVNKNPAIGGSNASYKVNFQPFMNGVITPINDLKWIGFTGVKYITFTNPILIGAPYLKTPFQIIHRVFGGPKNDRRLFGAPRPSWHIWFQVENSFWFSNTSRDLYITASHLGESGSWCRNFEDGGLAPLRMGRGFW